jgi:4-amino-4-deoxy-L-arabinose transferase-like glycosyltransferase
VRLPHVSRSSTAIAVAYLTTRLLLALSVDPKLFPDTYSYVLAGTKTVRPYGISALFDVLSAPAKIVVVQTLLGALATIWLAAELRNVSKLAAGLVLFLSLTKPFTLWDRTVLSETLSFGCIALLGACLLRWHHRGKRPLDALVVVLCTVVTALVREPVFLIFGVSTLLLVAIESLRASRSKRTIGLVATSLVIIPVLATVALTPSTIRYDTQRKVSFDNFRTMNVIGQRILPDPYLRAKLEALGMPKTEPADHVNRFAMDADWRLYAIPGMLEFADDFPTAGYLVAEGSRPTKFFRYAKSSLDTYVIEQTKGYEDGSYSDKIIPLWIENALWNWSGSLHLVFLTIAVLWAWSVSNRGIAIAAAAVGVLSSVGAVFAGTLDAMERQRHALPFVLVARVAIVVCVAELSWRFIQSRRQPMPLTR